jgi:NAD(P)-dependent dehydrogenase (short-subunit alcohol dehydrogenase family)
MEPLAPAVTGGGRMPSAIVTGAAGAIGSAVTRRLVALGFPVLAVDRDGRALGALERDLGELVVPLAADVSDEAQVSGYAAVARERWGGVDRFFNNAGVEGAVARTEEYPVDEFDRVLAINVRGIFLGLKHVLPVMSTGGAVVNTASALGILGAPEMPAYVASKHAVVGLTKVAALEQTDRGVRVNAVCPGPVAGRMITALEDATFGGDGSTFANLVPIGRYGRADEIAAMVMWLLSPEASFVTGAIHTIDGGQSAV